MGNNQKPVTTSRLTPEQFATKAIKALRTGEYKCIHTVYSGFNSAFREYFPGMDPKEEINKLAQAGKIETRFAKGGALIYLPGELVASTPRNDGKKTLAAMGL